MRGEESYRTAYSFYRVVEIGRDDKLQRILTDKWKAYYKNTVVLTSLSTQAKHPY